MKASPSLAAALVETATTLAPADSGPSRTGFSSTQELLEARRRLKRRQMEEDLFAAKARAERQVTISFQIPEKYAPAFRSLIEEFDNELGGRMEASFSFPEEQALTDATICCGKLRAAAFAMIPAGDASWTWGRKRGSR